jgi:hypothetical protein
MERNKMRPHLEVDRIYKNTANWKNPEDEFNSMFHNFPDSKGIRNMGGFRCKSKKGRSGSKIDDVAFVVLVTTFGEPEWPDSLDEETGVFIYYGDNRSPGDLHSTHLGGNSLLKEVFDRLHSGERHSIPPFLCFESKQTPSGSYMRYLGLAVPGAVGISPMEDLVAVWKRRDKRFQNYKSIFTILIENRIQWEWLDDLVNSIKSTDSYQCPPAWKLWVNTKKISALKCSSRPSPRSKNDQLPIETTDKILLDRIKKITNREFEYVARELLYMLDSSFTSLELTPPVKDGGRDIIGFYRVGKAPCQAQLTVFAEAKKWNGSVGVKPVARLISRIKHRDLGVFITTSWFDRQIQQELIDDKHPVILVSGKEITSILRDNDINTVPRLEEWLKIIIQ